GGKTVGDVAVRPQGKSIWSGNTNYPYYTTYGIGFYEYFLLCEDLHCLPIPVLNAGMTCPIQSNHYLVYPTNSKKFQQLIQDALDLVEFCRGDADTAWGAVRISMGHKEPFVLKYIAIGNEQWQSEYFEHYTLFVKAFEKAAKENPEMYGDIQLIVANSTSSGDIVGWNYIHEHSDNTTTALVDEHYYEPADWFFTNTTRYDNYDRSLNAKVFLGEYAAQANTLYAALSEAAYMTALERNGDVVKMACYAPLFANSTLNQWTPDLIWFSNHSVYGSINYYVQQLFSNNSGCLALPATLEQPQTLTQLSGAVGLGSWSTAVAYENFKVTSNSTGEMLCHYDFKDASQLKHWDIQTGKWSIKNGRLQQSSTAAPINSNIGDVIYIGDTTWSEYTLEVDAKILNGKEGFLIPVAVKGISDSIFWNLGGWENTISCLQTVSAGSKSGQIAGTVKNVHLDKNKIYHLKVTVTGDRIQCYLNNQLYINYEYVTKSNLYQSSTIGENGDLIIKLVNSTEIPQSLEIQLNDFDKTRYETSANIITLGNEDASSQNTYTNPEKVVPIFSDFDILDRFTYEIPAYSLVVMRIPAK
ncbi:MAG: alpha-L-arabinofuranosidase C-terminal domain-containing protein, partial [Lachnospiraceae bacterium]